MQIAALALILVAPPPPSPSLAEIWSAERVPAPGPAQAIGATAAGCLQGAAPLPPSGPGYEVLHLERRRNFGHPALVAYVRRLGGAARRARLAPLMVGDLSQARGGPTPSGHHSHQSGLDVDLGYAPPPGLRPGRLGPRDRARLAPPAVVDLASHGMRAPWGRRVRRLLALAAADPEVDRLFVNPAIKRELCSGPERGAPWLARVRPWWGHHDHFHVRLKCPPGSPLCQGQEPAADDGCGATLAWWFGDDAVATQARRQRAPEPVILPPACAALLAPAPAQPRAAAR